MKKILLTANALLCVLVAFSAPTANDLAKMTLKMNRLGYFAAGGSTITIMPADTQGDYTVTNFSGDAYSMPSPAIMHVDADGSVTIVPQVLGSTATSLYWIIPDAAKGKTPAQFTDADVITGQLADGKITINAYNVLVTSADSTQRLSVRYNQALTSVMGAPNATITRGRWSPQYDDDYEYFLGWSKGRLEEPEHVAYVEMGNGQLTVMNFDKLFAWGVFDLGGDGTFSIDPEQVVYRFGGSSNGDYVLAKIPAQLRTEEDYATGETVTGTIDDDSRTFTLTDIAVLKSSMQRIDYINGRPIYRLIITLDADEPATPGDVSGDGSVDIDDVNLVINMLLEYVEKTPAADLTGDGNVDIADVNAIINLILTQ